MRSESRENRLMWWGAAVGLLTDLGVSVAIVFVVVEMLNRGISIPFADFGLGADFLADELGLVTILVVFVGIQIMKILVWVRGWISQTLSFRLYQRDYLIDLFLDGVTKAELPEPPHGFKVWPQSYFDSVLVNDSLDCQKRIEAAYWLAVLQFPTNMGRYWEGVYLEVVMEDALVKYRECFDFADLHEGNF